MSDSPVDAPHTFLGGFAVRLRAAHGASGETRHLLMRLGMIAEPIRVNASGAHRAPGLPIGGADDYPMIEFRGYRGRREWLPLAHIVVEAT